MNSLGDTIHLTWCDNTNLSQAPIRQSGAVQVIRKVSVSTDQRDSIVQDATSGRLARADTTARHGRLGALGH